jgi:serine/threonine protein kinase
MPFGGEALNKTHFLSPEVLFQSYTEKCDIWAIGVIAYELMSKQKPFDHAGNDQDEILSQIKKGSFSFEGAPWR